MGLKEEFINLQKDIVKYQKLEIKINSAQKKFSDMIKNRTFQYNGEDCYVSYVNFETDRININPIKNIGTRVDYVVVKQFTFEDFFDEYFE